MTELDSPAVDPSTRPMLTSDERDELVRLRREVVAMRSAPPPRARRRFRWRSGALPSPRFGTAPQAMPKSGWAARMIDG
jgi:hypothetical protein